MDCDCGQVVSVLDFYFDDPSSNPAEAYSFSLKFVVKKNDFCHNKLCWISCLESGARESLVMASGLSIPKLLIQTPIWSQSIRTRILKSPSLPIFSRLKMTQTVGRIGSCCGTVDNVVTSDTRVPWFESSYYLAIFIEKLSTVNCL